jgi:predicted kinase
MENSAKNRKIIPPGACLVVMVAPSGAGKTTFCEKHFEAREVISTDAIREWFTGGIEDQSMNTEVFQEFHRRIEVKLAAGQRVVADATHVRNADRRRVAEIGAMMGVPVYYVVINRSVESKLQTGGWRTECFNSKGVGLIERMEQTFLSNEKEILSGDNKLAKVIDTRVDDFEVVTPLPRDPFAVSPHLLSRGFTHVRFIGDVHGNLKGFEKALDAPESTFIFSMGDILDYGVDTLKTTEMMYDIAMSGRGIMIRGNHERKIFNFVTQERKDGFRGRLSSGNEITANQLKALGNKRRRNWEDKFLGLMRMSPDVIQFGKRWMFAHGAVHEKMWNNLPRQWFAKNSKLEAYAMFGETTGKFVDGFPERLYDWVDVLGPGQIAMVGHAVLSTEAPVEMNGKNGGKAIFLDTGSSKEIDGNFGHLSWVDLPLDEKKGLLPEFVYGRE